MPSLFSLSQAAFAFPGCTPALSGVCADIRARRLTVVLGANGAGKSVLLSLLAGLRRPSSGAVALQGKPVADWAPKAWARQVAWVPHTTSGGEWFSVREVVEMGRFPHGESRAKTLRVADEMIALFQLKELAGRPLGTLSAGQRRRALLARATAQLHGVENGVMLLDEPDANLDPAQSVALFRLLRQLLPAGITVVAVVHDLHLATEFADDAWLMKGGSLIAAGPADDVLRYDTLEETYGVRMLEVPTVCGKVFRVVA